VQRHVLYLGEINDSAELLRGCAAPRADARGRVNGAAPLPIRVSPTPTSGSVQPCS
jgi:hypothetical protein